MIDRSQIKRGLLLKGGEFPGAIVRKDPTPEERKADVERRILDDVKARNATIARNLETMRLALAARKWRRMHSL